MVLDAVAPEKAIYCEKGLTTSIAAAKRMRAAVKKASTVFQLGHQGRQLPATAEAGRLIREGKIGPVTVINTGRFFNGSKEQAPWRWYGYYSQWERPDPKDVLAQLDWEAWLGPARKIDFNERHFWHWRCYWPYGTGQAGDLLSHELDHVQTVLGLGHPGLLHDQRMERLLQGRPRSARHLDVHLSLRKPRLHPHLRRLHEFPA
jgi:predicted dehydrogenase